MGLYMKISIVVIILLLSLNVSSSFGREIKKIDKE
jgi:hypothetical protein